LLQLTPELAQPFGDTQFKFAFEKRSTDPLSDDVSAFNDKGLIHKLVVFMGMVAQLESSILKAKPIVSQVLKAATKDLWKTKSSDVIMCHIPSTFSSSSATSSTDH
jgi:hypothetical protein